ncbi:MAG: hypothetical protein N4A71_09980 [Carboxylicivirga sp.]|jgi:hypothetical protein|nr:hypothetical protein [Carboxylicivirga sp.]
MKKPSVIIVIFWFIGNCMFQVSGQSAAHKNSKFAIIDPTYNSSKQVPASSIKESKTPWIYGAAELESWRLQLLRKRKDEARLNVGYPGEFHKVFTKGAFRLQSPDLITISKLRFKAVGRGKIYIDNKFFTTFSNRDEVHTFHFNDKQSLKEIRFDMEADGEPFALLIEDKELATSSSLWEWKANDQNWQAVSYFAQNIYDIPPHLLEDPTVELSALEIDENLFDFGCELLGHVKLKCEQCPVINVGESVTEALDLHCQQKEQSLEMIQVSEGLWRSKNPLAFRYLFVRDLAEDAILCDAIFSPATYKGAFSCSDSTLTKVWMNSAYTLRLCMHDFLLDGIKRDRLPWTGDLAISMYANAYSFSDPELVRRSLVALGRAGIHNQDINGIIDYSLWWIIAQDQYQLYYGDAEHLRREWNRIIEALQVLKSRCDENGFLIPKGTWLFIDWVDDDKWTALQILWWWAQKSAAQLAHRMGEHETKDLWNKQADNLQIELKKAAWNEERQVWYSKNDFESEITRHPNFLSVVSGFTPAGAAQGIKEVLEGKELKPVGTPYMAGFEMMALAQLGNTDYMLKHVKEYWGGMLKQGATTFWEAYDANDTGGKQYAFYNRPYAKSLCHAWSAGPAAFLPGELLGIKPLADGWQHFKVKPRVASLENVHACVPTRFGNIEVDVEDGCIRVKVPKGTVMEWKEQLIMGPAVFKEKL